MKRLRCVKSENVGLSRLCWSGALIADKRPKAELIEKIEKHDVNETKYVAEEKDYVEEADVTRPRHAHNEQLCHEISEEFVRIDKKNQSEGEIARRRRPHPAATPPPLTEGQPTVRSENSQRKKANIQ